MHAYDGPARNARDGQPSRDHPLRNDLLLRGGGGLPFRDAPPRSGGVPRLDALSCVRPLECE
jgi:hypothetical protein